MGPVILDGKRLSERREPALAARARALSTRRGYPPRLALIAFQDTSGVAPHTARKVRAGRSAGIEVVPVLFPEDASMEEVLTRMSALNRDATLDALFLQFPCPEGIDLDQLARAIPPELDVDIMTPLRIEQFLADPAGMPPVTVSAALELLDAYEISITSLRGVVVADENPFTTMFREALSRRGAIMQSLVAPRATDLATRVRSAQLVVAAAASPGVIHSGMLSPGAVAIDAGYFNPGARGDIDTANGIEHLSAIALVPGGIGPMTVSCLIERVIRFAEGQF